MIEALIFAFQCFRIYRRHQRASRGLATYHRHAFEGVPDLTMIVGSGREAWRISDIATHYFAQRGMGLL